MKINIKATNIELTPSLRALINKKLRTLSSRIAKQEKEGMAQLYVEIGRQSRHHHKGAIFYAEANLELSGKIIRATHTDTTMQKSITAIKNILKERIETNRGKSA